MSNSLLTLSQGLLIQIGICAMLSSCQMGDYAEEETANHHFYSKEDSLKAMKQGQLDSVKEAEKTKDAMFTSP